MLRPWRSGSPAYTGAGMVIATHDGGILREAWSRCDESELACRLHLPKSYSTRASSKFTMSSVPVLRSGGKAAIDNFLHESAVDDSIPAVFFGATNAKEQLYYEAEGDMVFGEPSKGQVNIETSRSSKHSIR